LKSAQLTKAAQHAKAVATVCERCRSERDPRAPTAAGG
jgi:hypothetical protein